MNYNSKFSRSAAHSRAGRTWYPRPLPGQRACEFRASQPRRGVPPDAVRAGDRFGYRAVLRADSRTVRRTVKVHGFPCGCMFGSPTRFTDPEICWAEDVTETLYEFYCLCECCGHKSYVDPWSLLHGFSLSCCGRWRGQLWHRIRAEKRAVWQHSMACLCGNCAHAGGDAS